MTTANYKRPERVGESVKEEIASMVLNGELKDPRIGFVTITHVKMSPDLKEARVYFSLIGDEKGKKRTLEGLKSAAGFIRRSLAKRLNLRRIPSISFSFDESLEYSSRIEKVIKEMKEGGGA